MTPISVWLPMRVRGIALASGVAALWLGGFLLLLAALDYLGLL